MPSIPLHPELGVNPKLTVCAHCGKEMDELILLGAHTSIYGCRVCGVNHIGGKPKGLKCLCGAYNNFERVGEVGEHDKLPASRLCDDCQRKQDECDQVVADGGILWRCADCGSAGAIKPSSGLAQAVREKHGPKFTEGPPYKPCGVEFTKDDCPCCCGQKREEKQHA